MSTIYIQHSFLSSFVNSSKSEGTIEMNVAIKFQLTWVIKYSSSRNKPYSMEVNQTKCSNSPSFSVGKQRIVRNKCSFIPIIPKRFLSFDALFSYLLEFYELNGFHHSVWTHRGRIKYSILVLHLILLIYFTQSGVRFIFTFHQISRYKKDVNLFSLIFFYCVVMATYWMIVIDSFSQEAAQQTFCKIVDDFHETKERRIFIRSHILKFGIHLIGFTISFRFCLLFNVKTQSLY